MRAFRHQLARELGAYFNVAPNYAMLTAFLLVVGFVFTLSLWTQAARLEPASYAMTMEAVSFLSILLTALLTMRLFAEEKNRGTLELLLTAPIRDREVVAAKFLGALLFFACMLAPTLVYVVLLRQFGHADWGATLTAYLGVLLQAAALLALGIFISALSPNQVTAGLVTLMASMILLFLSWAGGAVREATWIRSVLLTFSFSDHVSDFARGIFDSRRALFFVCFAALFLFGTAGVLASRREARRRRRVALLTASVVLFAANLAVLYATGLYHFVRLDLTAARRFELDPRTVEVLRRLPEDVHVFLTPLAADPRGRVDEGLLRAWQRMREFLSECRQYTDRLRVSELDENDAEKIQQLGNVFRKLDYNYVYLYTSRWEEGRRESFPLQQIFDWDETTGRITRWAAEPKLLATLRNLFNRTKKIFYGATGHGELSPDSPREEGFKLCSDYLALMDEIEIRPIYFGTYPRVPLNAEALLILGPREKFSPAEADAVAEYLERGGRVFVALYANTPAGLSDVLRAYGLDADLRPVRSRSGLTPQVLLAAPTDHPVNLTQAGNTYFFVNGCVVGTVPDPPKDRDVRILLMSGQASEAATRRPAGEVWEPSKQDAGFPVAATVDVRDAGDPRRSKSRLIVWGSVHTLWNLYAGQFPTVKEYFLNNIRWLTERQDEILPVRQLEERPIHLTPRDRWVVAGISVGLVPCLAATLGFVTWFLRRR